MVELFDKLAIRIYAPRRRALGMACSVVGAMVLLYLAFEAGRHDGGYRVVDSVRGALSASSRIGALEAENAGQRSQLEAADVARRVDREGYKQVEQSLGDMQSQIARLNQDLSFYRGLVQPESLIHVKVQRMQIVPDTLAGKYRLKFVLMQTGKNSDSVVGYASVSVDGLLHGRPANLGLPQLSPARRASLAYAFRYFQDYDEPIALPPGFEPTRVGVEIHSGRDAVHSFKQAFAWKAQGMSTETEANDDPAAKDRGAVPTETE